MPKTGILSVSPISISSRMSLKKQFLMFDKIYIENNALEIAKLSREALSTIIKDRQEFSGLPETFSLEKPLGQLLGIQNQELLNHNLNSINFLGTEGFIELIDFRQEIVLHENSIDSNLLMLIEKLDSSFIEPDPTNLINTIGQIPDATARVLTVLRKTPENPDIFPLLLGAPNNSEIGKKAVAFNFLLTQMPEPDDAVPWEQLFDFKKDPVTMASYYALIDWLNEIVRKEYSFTEIEDKY